MKIVLVLLDGLGDRAYSVLEQRTPLQAASKTHLDRLASLGSNGLFHAALCGQCLPSENAHYLIFGFEMREFPGRGPLEAMGYGVPFDQTDVVSLAHFSCVAWQGKIPVLTHSRRDIRGDEEEMNRLYESLTPYESEGVRLRLHQTHLNDAVLVLSGEVSPYVCDSDPMAIGRPMAMIQPLWDNPEPEKAARTARALNAYLSHCHRVLMDHEVNRLRESRNQAPANFLATQRCGRLIKHESFQERWDLSAMLIGSGAVYEGLAKDLGMTFVRMKDGKDPGKDLRERIEMALADSSHDFVHVHTKVPDEAAHTGDPVKKLRAIESLDRGLGVLVKAVEQREDLLVAVTADHSTASITSLIHSGEPVPLTVVGPGVRRDGVRAYDEVTCASGCLGLLRGKELMLMLLNYADRSALMGHRLEPLDRPCVPQIYKPFKMSD